MVDIYGLYLWFTNIFLYRSLHLWFTLYLYILVNFKVNFLRKSRSIEIEPRKRKESNEQAAEDKCSWNNVDETDLQKDRITKRGHKFDEHVCSHRAKSTRNWSFLISGCHAALVFHVSLHWEHRFRRVASPTPFAKRPFARMHVAAAFFSLLVPSLKSMQIFHEALSIVERARARAFATPIGGGKKKKTRRSLQTSHSFPAALSSRPFFILSTLADVAVRETNL